jgi:tetratricopeptide (TPR) repeat protein
MGVVYKALQRELKRPVALKMILAGSHASAGDLLRFRAEAEAVAQLQHPNIVQVYEIGTHEGLPFFALEYVPGGSLDKFLAGQPQPPQPTAALVATLAEAMQAAHGKNIVHRDLKPANILLSPKSEIRNPKSETNPKFEQTKSQTKGRQVSDFPPLDLGFVSDFGFRISDFIPKVTDFGLAKRLELEGQTKTGDLLGTPSYMAPEQAGRNRQVGPATDIYALGAILYEMLTGRPPFQGISGMDTVLQVLTVEPVPPRRLVPSVPRDLEIICLKCLEKEPSRRYASAQALADDLRRFLAGEPIQAKAVTRMERTIKWAKRRPAVAGLLATLLAVTVAAFVVVCWLWQDAEQQKALLTRTQGELIASKETVTQEKNKAVTARDEALHLKTQAEAAERKAKAEEERARKAAAKAEAINRFLIRDLLGQVQPERAQNRNLTFEEALIRASQELRVAFIAQPEVEAEIRNLFGTTFLYLARPDLAQPHVERAVELTRQIYGPDDRQTLVAQFNLAGLLRDIGKEAEAAKLYQEAWEHGRKVLPPQDAVYQGLLEGWASVTPNKEESRQLRRQMIQVRRGTPRWNTDETVRLINNLVMNEIEGRTEEPDVDALYKEALEICEKHLTWKNPSALSLIHNYVNYLIRHKRLVEAEKYSQLQMRNVPLVLGKDHPSALGCVFNHGNLLRSQGRFAEAEPHYRYVADKAERIMGKYHPHRLVTLEALANTLYHQGKTAEAITVLQEVAAGRGQTGGFTKGSMIDSLQLLAKLLFESGKVEEALPLLREAYAARKKLLGIDHPETLQALSNLGVALSRAKKHVEAEQALQEVATKRRRLFGPLHPQTLEALGTLGVAQLTAGKLAEAAATLQETVTGWEKAGTSPAQTAASRSELGRALLLQKNFPEAEKVLLQAWKEISARQDVSPKIRGEILTRLIQLYEAWGKPAQAASWRKQLPLTVL